MRNLAVGQPAAGRLAPDPLRPRRFFLGGLAAGIVVMSVTGLAAVSLIESPGQVAARSAAPPGSVITVRAKWEVLRNAITTQGVVRAARTVTVTASAPFRTVTVTRMPVKAGERVWSGHVIAEIDGRPVIVLQGRLPAYRNLHQGDHGPDVSQLQAGLEHLGYADFDLPGYFGKSTSLALLLFYRRLGYQAPLYHPPGAVRGRRSGKPVPPRRTGAAPPIPDAYLPMSEVSYIPARSALVVWVGARVGAVTGGRPVLRLATGKPYVAAKLSPHQAGLVRRGMPARLVSASPALTAAGRVIRVGSRFAVRGPPVRYPVQVRTGRALPQRLVGAPVRLTIWAPVTSRPVLAVPVTAVFAASGKAAYVTRISPGHRRRVRILTGPSADGMIAVRPVRPGHLRPGDRVLVGRGP